ncbi:MAG: FkbM family methyltransferase [Chloroflexota bacterium]
MSRLMRLRAAIVRVLPQPARRFLRTVLPKRLTGWTPATRTVRIRMPDPPPGLGPVVRPRALPPVVTMTAPYRSYVPRLLEENGVARYEPETMAAYLASISVLGARDVLDIGANVGIFAIVGAATTTARITGFEPTPSLSATFRDTCVANALTCDVEAIALGSRSGRATLYLSAVTDSSNSLQAGFRPTSGAVEVPVERLDDWAARTGRRPAVIKMDTESTEPEVLAGGRELLRAHAPWVICEVLANRTEGQLTEILSELGYRFHHLGRGEVPTESPEIIGDPTWLQRDWLFTPGPLPPAFATHYSAWLEAILATR